MVTLHNLLATSPVDYRLFAPHGAALLGNEAKATIRNIISLWWMW
jgi:hypothetical protein